MIFLAAGILDGGVSTSNRAKATTLVILAIVLAFGMYAFTMNSSAYTITLAGILMGIAFPAVVIAYLAMKHPQYAKPVGIIVSLASTTGIVAWVAFGFVSPDTYMIPQVTSIVDENVEVVESSAPVFAISILEGSSVQGAPDYDPDIATVQQGYVVEWTNHDTVAHTVTSAVDFGETFDSSLFDSGATFRVDTSKLESGEYEYLCIVHPWMNATLVVTAPKEPTLVTIPNGASVPGDDKIFYDPPILNIEEGTTVQWDNIDSTFHSVTAGTPPADMSGMFDSEMMSAGDKFEYTFSEAGTYNYFCIFHPWMVGTVNVE
jgi:plastocyanin